MAEELPDWMQEFPESYSEASADKEKKAPEKRPKPKAKVSPKKSPLTKTQGAILAGLLLMLCFICTGLIGVTYANRQALFSPARQAIAATPAPQITPTRPSEETLPSPTPTPTATVTPSPRPTLALPEPPPPLRPARPPPTP